MNGRGVLGRAVAVLAASVVVNGCGGATAPTSSSPVSTTSPSSSSPLVVALGGPLSTVTPRAGALKGHTLPGGHVLVHLTGGSLLFVVRTVPKAAVFRCALYALPHQRKVPTSVTVTSSHGSKTYEVRPSEPLAPGPYRLDFGGAGRFQMSLYEPEAP